MRSGTYKVSKLNLEKLWFPGIAFPQQAKGFPLHFTHLVFVAVHILDQIVQILYPKGEKQVTIRGL